MAWWTGEPFDRRIDIEMTRIERESPDDDNELRQSGRISGALWSHKGQAHFLVYDGEWESGDELGDGTEDRGSSRTIWKLEENQVTLIRHGWVRWTLHFVPGVLTTTTGYLGDTPVPVEVTTDVLSIDLQANGGRVLVAWRADVAGTPQSVTLEMQIGPVLGLTDSSRCQCPSRSRAGESTYSN